MKSSIVRANWEINIQDGMSPVCEHPLRFVLEVESKARISAFTLNMISDITSGRAFEKLSENGQKERGLEFLDLDMAVR